MINPILSFINRRFPYDSNWLNGNCYFFALILIDRFPSLRMYYDPIEGHFVVSSDGETFLIGVEYAVILMKNFPFLLRLSKNLTLSGMRAL